MIHILFIFVIAYHLLLSVSYASERMIIYNYNKKTAELIDEKGHHLLTLNEKNVLGVTRTPDGKYIIHKDGVNKIYELRRHPRYIGSFK